jgi:hypothetical protein
MDVHAARRPLPVDWELVRRHGLTARSTRLSPGSYRLEHAGRVFIVARVLTRAGTWRIFETTPPSPARHVADFPSLRAARLSVESFES